MTRKDIYDLHEQVSRMALGVLKTKMQDFTSTDEDHPFKCMEAAANAVDGKPHDIIIARMIETVYKLNSYANSPSRSNISVENSCCDLINWTILLQAMIVGKKSTGIMSSCFP